MADNSFAAGRNDSLSSLKDSPETSLPTQEGREQFSPTLPSLNGETREPEETYAELDKMWESAGFKKVGEISLDQLNGQCVMTPVEDRTTSGSSDNLNSLSPIPPSSCSCSGLQHSHNCCHRLFKEIAGQTRLLKIKPIRPMANNSCAAGESDSLNSLKDSPETSLPVQKGHDQSSPMLPSPKEETREPEKTYAELDKIWESAGFKKVGEISVDQMNGQYIMTPVEDRTSSGSSDNPDSLSPTPPSSCSDSELYHINEAGDIPAAASRRRTQSGPPEIGSEHGEGDSFASANASNSNAERGEDIICFRGIEKLNGIARAIAETQRNCGRPDYAIVGPFSYVDVFSDPEQEPTELRMTASELEASVNPDDLQSYWGEYGSDFEVDEDEGEDDDDD